MILIIFQLSPQSFQAATPKRNRFGSSQQLRTADGCKTYHKSRANCHNPNMLTSCIFQVSETIPSVQIYGIILYLGIRIRANCHNSKSSMKACLGTFPGVIKAHLAIFYTVIKTCLGIFLTATTFKGDVASALKNLPSKSPHAWFLDAIVHPAACPNGKQRPTCTNRNDVFLHTVIQGLPAVQTTLDRY